MNSGKILGKGVRLAAGMGGPGWFPEEIGPILDHAWRFALWIVVFMGAIFSVLQFITWQLG